MVSKETVKHLAELARLKMPTEQEEKMAKDLEGILSHFQELAVLNTENIEPVSGGTELTNILREDKVLENSNREILISSFPKEKDGYNSVPPVFN
jgi:aspartyl-tRNA(Asn)/glutamyl-tRNA(Gln) amidotransferase subunit C